MAQSRERIHVSQPRLLKGQIIIVLTVNMNLNAAPAAQFIVDKIVEQAEAESISLSEVERKMLLFSESSPTLSDIAEVNEVFDRDYDRPEYEKKITGLIRNIQPAVRENSDATRMWNEAIKSLRGEDYYFMVMLNEAGTRGRPRGDLIRLIVTAVIIVCVMLAIAFFFTR